MELTRLIEKTRMVFAAGEQKGEQKKEKEDEKILDAILKEQTGILAIQEALINGDQERAEEIMREMFGEDKNETEDH
jgi:DNA-binding GntR family transcriptional regulator